MAFVPPLAHITPGPAMPDVDVDADAVEPPPPAAPPTEPAAPAVPEVLGVEAGVPDAPPAAAALLGCIDMAGRPPLGAVAADAGAPALAAGAALAAFAPAAMLAELAGDEPTALGRAVSASGMLCSSLPQPINQAPANAEAGTQHTLKESRRVMRRRNLGMLDI